MRCPNLDRDSITPIIRIVLYCSEFSVVDCEVYVDITGQPERLCNVLRVQSEERHYGRQLIEPNSIALRE